MCVAVRVRCSGQGDGGGSRDDGASDLVRGLLGGPRGHVRRHHHRRLRGRRDQGSQDAQDHHGVPVGRAVAGGVGQLRAGGRRRRHGVAVRRHARPPGPCRRARRRARHVAQPGQAGGGGGHEPGLCIPDTGGRAAAVDAAGVREPRRASPSSAVRQGETQATGRRSGGGGRKGWRSRESSRSP